MFKNIIKPNTYQLLLKLGNDDYFKDFFLVGGTALTLQIQNRFSKNLYFVNEKEFNTHDVINKLQNREYKFEILYQEKNTLRLLINHIKVEFITHPFPLLKPHIELNGIKLASILDIAAMKINAIIHSGGNWDDFMDIYFILGYYHLEAILNAFKTKYQQTNLSVALKSLNYFEAIKYKKRKYYLDKKLSYRMIKERIIESINNKYKIFNNN